MITLKENQATAGLPSFGNNELMRCLGSEARQWHRFNCKIKNLDMKQDQPDNQQPNDLTNPYDNGQSESEQLMRKHLQTPGHVISDEELKSMRIGTDDMSATPVIPPSEDDAELDADDKPVTPWDVLDP